MTATPTMNTVRQNTDADLKNLDVTTDVTVGGTLSVTGATTLTGAITATGGVTGNVTGNVTGGILQTTSAVTADGAITIPSYSTIYHITKAGVAAMTIADPTATTHDGLTLTFIADTANAHTLSNAAGSGFNGGGAASDVGTFGGAIGDGITITAYQGVWYVMPGSNTNVTLA